MSPEALLAARPRALGAGPSLEPAAPRRLAWLTAGCAWLLLVAGGLVTSTGSSLAVPDWPLSFGQVMPAMIGGVLFEHGHRMIAGFVAFLAILQCAWALARGERGWRKSLALASAGAILVQAALGGATVLLRLPPQISIAHACLGQTVFCLLLAFAESLSPSWRGPSWGPGALAYAAVYVQLALGAVLRHTGQGLAAHAAWAAVVLVMAGRLPYLAFFRGAGRALSTPSALLGALLPLQLLLGYASYRIRFSPDFETGFHAGSALVTAHVAVGAAILGSCLIWALRYCERRP